LNASSESGGAPSSAPDAPEVPGSGHVPAISLIAAFPELVEQACRVGVTGRALDRGLWRYNGFSLRDFATDARKTIDGRPAGGGPGMVLMAAPLRAATQAARQWHGGQTKVILLSPDGDRFDQPTASRLAREPNVTLVAGRYEGLDQRWIDECVDLTISIGDYVISGGELAAAVVIDAMVRLLPGALGDSESAVSESFSAELLDWPQYALTNAAGNADIPKTLLGGNHALIDRWRREQALLKTARRRPDLLRIAQLSQADRDFLSKNGL
jgi:tRNA (guanine37-N1)-methyltransferase